MNARRRTLFSASLAAVLLVGVAAFGQQWDLSALPEYRPEHKISGVIRNFGTDFGGMLKTWEAGFQKYQPDARFEDNLPTSDAAMGGLVAGVCDVAPSGREITINEYLSFFETFNYYPLELTVASGSFDVKGMSWGLVVFVHRDNPITKATVTQLDGIFGSERTGGWKGLAWSPEAARAASGNIRRWGQLGLTGEWSDKPIDTYGYAPSGMRSFFELRVFQGGNKWNPNYREYVETGGREVAAGDRGPTLSIQHMLAELANNRYGIAYTGMQYGRNVPEIKPIALSWKEEGPYVEPTKQNFQNRSYPLARSVYMFLNRPPGKPLDSKVEEFVKYILSRQGQEDVARSGAYLPLPADAVHEQLQKLR
ncbi:MAG: phosphate ABC transporter substrate-binding protein [Acidobacteria bacterium]|nr:phosphate ABC transporter substrate-binding protein [Acidobacteriota bacterium]MBV9146189.1 phosphate ABC transporter substrate-binding protein [Acidobacteriota bacterium]MBV9437954.1 phosphate ABC transporter substrate-binding protein [Acidobacteriota bacterium]